MDKSFNNNNLETLLLLALPASGKSEVRKYLAGLSEQECHRDFHLGPTIQLDDFPYVHMMRCIDEQLALLNQKRIFFNNSDKPFREPKDWGTLISLINEDYADLIERKIVKSNSAASWLMERFDRSARKVGIPYRLATLDDKVRAVVAEKIETEAAEMLRERNILCHTDISGKTVVIEFARGGPHGSNMPLTEPFGYNYSLSKLSPAILKKARILYVWVTPEESRRKNIERTNPNDPGSILHHGVPMDVMMNDYGCDDIEWLEKTARRPGTVSVQASSTVFDIPIARFDNRVDKTSFVRNNPTQWKKDEICALHDGLKGALQKLS
ncbi:MAG: hypothetical protein AABZ06_10410 [Bdellovibrionota bacterium]